MGGYTLGSSLSQVRTQCNAHKGRWIDDGIVHACFGQPDAGTGHLLEFGFCDAGLCAVESVFFLFTADADGWRTTFNGTIANTQAKFGPPSTAIDKIPHQCRRRLVECVHKERAQVFSTWSANDKVAQVAMVASSEGVPAVGASLAAPVTFESGVLLGRLIGARWRLVNLYLEKARPSPASASEPGSSDEDSSPPNASKADPSSAGLPQERPSQEESSKPDSSPAVPPKENSSETD